MLSRQVLRTTVRARAAPSQSLLRHYGKTSASSSLLQSSRTSLALIRQRTPTYTFTTAPRRLAATGVLPGHAKKRGVISRVLHKTATYLGIFVIGSGVAVAALFAYDYSTYTDVGSEVDIPVSELALHPRRGGPKNLPIIDHFVDDDESEEARAQKHKPKLVLLGTGWGNVALLKNLHADEYHVTVISPSNYFLFTPMLPSATVGTLELRSLVEPIRRILPRVRGHFLKGSAEDVDFSEKLVEVSALGTDGSEQRFYVPYDKLVVGVGELI